MTKQTYRCLPPEEIRAAVNAWPDRRERDLARELDISEAQLAAAFCGHRAQRIEASMAGICEGMRAVGEVMVQTRNENAVIEKIGPFERFVNGTRTGLMLGSQIGTRMFPGHWVHAFAMERPSGQGQRRSLQVFDAHGGAVIKVQLRAASDAAAFEALVERLLSPDQTPGLDPVPFRPQQLPSFGVRKAKALGGSWAAANGLQQDLNILRELDIERIQAEGAAVEEDKAWQVDGDSIRVMLRLVSGNAIPVKCFAGNRGCVQIHSGPVSHIKEIGPWINVMDPTFHLHLRLDHIHEIWAVRQGADAGQITSLDAYGADGSLIIQFFGLRGEGNRERKDWRELVEHLPRLASHAAPLQFAAE
jgi:putative hemin transport protein